MDRTEQADSTGDKRHATVRCGPASLTATACRAPSDQPYGLSDGRRRGHVREDAR